MSKMKIDVKVKITTPTHVETEDLGKAITSTISEWNGNAHRQEIRWKNINNHLKMEEIKTVQIPHGGGIRDRDQKVFTAWFTVEEELKYNDFKDFLVKLPSMGFDGLDTTILKCVPRIDEE